MLNKIQNNRDKISGHTHPVFRVERILMVGVFLRFLRNRIATSARTAPRRFISGCTQSVGAGIQRLSFVKRWMEASKDSYRRKERKMIQFDFFSNRLERIQRNLCVKTIQIRATQALRKLTPASSRGWCMTLSDSLVTGVASAMRYGSTLHTCLIQASRLVIKLSLIRGSLRIPVSVVQATPVDHNE
jgi:hypothetical protein